MSEQRLSWVRPAIRGVSLLGALLLLYLIARVVFLSTPDKITIESQVVVQQVQALGRLELVKFQLRDVLTKKIENRYWYDTKVLLIISGEVIGCVDLQKLKPNDIEVLGDSVSLKLPPPEICVVKVDHENTKIYNTEFTLLDYIEDRHAEILQQTFREAESQIRNAALSQGILKETRENAEKFFQPFFKSLGFKKLNIQFKTDGSAG